LVREAGGHNRRPWTLGALAIAEAVFMDLHPLVLIEWREDHALSMRSLIWIEDHADPGDRHPIVTAITQLRDQRVDRLVD
jgi:hypothetical protein